MSELAAATARQLVAFVASEPDQHLAEAAQTIEPDAFRKLLSNVPVPVAVLTTALGDRWDGITISSFMTVALEPPLIAVSLNRDKPATSLTLQAACFAINLLDGGDAAVADRFAAHHSLPRFEGIATELGPRGLPILTNAIAVLYAHVVDVEGAGDHYLITGEVFATRSIGGVPLMRHRSRYTQPLLP